MCLSSQTIAEGGAQTDPSPSPAVRPTSYSRTLDTPLFQTGRRPCFGRIVYSIGLYRIARVAANSHALFCDLSFGINVFDNNQRITIFNVLASVTSVACNSIYHTV